MTFKNEQELRKYLIKRVRYDVAKEKWGFNGVKFRLETSYFNGEFTTWVNFTCDLNDLNVVIERFLTRTKEMVAVKSFSGNNAISDCIDWVVDKLVEVYTLLNERTAPYVNNKLMYELMLNRPLSLQEG